MGRLRRWKEVANVATPPDGTSEEAAPNVEVEPTERFFQVENHLHLNLNLRLGAVYPEAELRRKCPQDKLAKLEKCLSDTSMLKEVAAPENNGEELSGLGLGSASDSWCGIAPRTRRARPGSLPFASRRSGPSWFVIWTLLAVPVAFL